MTTLWSQPALNDAWGPTPPLPRSHTPQHTPAQAELSAPHRLPAPNGSSGRSTPRRRAVPAPANEKQAGGGPPHLAVAPRASPLVPCRTPCRRAWLLRARTQARCHCSRRDLRARSAVSSARAPASSVGAPRRRSARRAVDRQYCSSQAATVSSEAAKSSTSAAQPRSGPMARCAGLTEARAAGLLRSRHRVHVAPPRPRTRTRRRRLFPSGAAKRARPPRPGGAARAAAHPPPAAPPRACGHPV